MNRVKLWCTPLVIELLVISSSAFATTPVQSQTFGGFRIPITRTTGNSLYSINYSFPSAVSVDRNFTVTVLLGVDQFTGFKSYLEDYSISVAVHLQNGFLVNNTISAYADSDRLYQGGRWGPTNFTMSIPARDSGIPQGQQQPANLTIRLSGSVWYDEPVYAAIPENATGLAGQILVSSIQPTPAIGTRPLVLFVTGVVLLAMGYLVKGRSSKHPVSENPK